MPTAPLPRYRLILLPVDGSPESQNAAMHAATLASALSAPVAILAVMDTGGELAFTPDGMANYARLRTEAQAAIEVASAVIRGAGVSHVEHLIMDGIPAVGIVETAAELGASLIVLGVARCDRDGAVPGAVARAILHDAPCPTLLVSPPARGR